MKRGVIKKALMGLTGLALVGLIAYAYHDTSNQDFAEHPEAINVEAAEAVSASLLKPGTVAPELALTAEDGTFYTLDQFKGKQWVLLEFFASACPHCQRSVPLVKDILSQHGDAIQVLAINAGDTMAKPPTSKAFKQAFDIHYPILEWPSNALIDSYGVKGFPTFYLVNPEGKIVWVREGELRPEQVEQIDALIPG